MDKRPLRVGLVFLSAALALAAMLLTGCGGSDDRTKVEASLQELHWAALIQKIVSFPIGGGPAAAAGQELQGSARHDQKRPGLRISQRRHGTSQRDSRCGRASSHSETASRCQWTSL